jgi:protein SCO1/2
LQITLWIAAIVATAVFAWSRWPAGSFETAETPAAFEPSFALADSEGKLRTSAEFRGKFLLVFFGFTNCPDVCPTTLSEVAQVMDDLGPDAGKVQPIFVSIDPERDRRLGLSTYTEAFHPSILGLAGTRPHRLTATPCRTAPGFSWSVLTVHGCDSSAMARLPPTFFPICNRGSDR